MKSADLFGLVTDYRGRVCNEFLGVVGPIKVVRWQVSSVWRLLMKDATSTWIVANCFVILIFFYHLTVVQWLMDKNEERTWSKQPIFCRRHFQINLLVWKLLWRYFNSNFNEKCSNGPIHYDDVIMSAIASQITSLTIVYSIVYSDTEQKKHQSSASLAFVWGIHRGPVNSPQMASYAENVSIWWRHHVTKSQHWSR